MMKIGITGQAGFVGTHLFNYFALQEGIERVPFKDDYFKDKTRLEEFVAQCDAIVHLAAMNRHGDPQVIYDTNISLVKSLIDACIQTNSTPHILFSSSTQEERDNLYGKSKKDGRFLFESWAKTHKSSFTGFIIPNVFGPFGHPYYNSVVATFCHQLTHGETPDIHVDGTINLIYVNTLIRNIFEAITSNLEDDYRTIEVPLEYSIKVSDILKKLESFKREYFDKGNFPSLTEPIDLDMFNTFRCYIPHDTYPFKLVKHVDTRGHFVEVAMTNTSGQFSFSLTKPGIVRGNHYHTRKAERFAVIQGKALIELRRTGTDEVISYELDGEEPSFVDMPIWYTHNIKNIGDQDLLTLFWINEPFNPDDPDTFFETV